MSSYHIVSRMMLVLTSLDITNSVYIATAANPASPARLHCWLADSPARCTSSSTCSTSCCSQCKYPWYCSNVGSTAWALGSTAGGEVVVLAAPSLLLPLSPLPEPVLPPFLPGRELPASEGLPVAELVLPLTPLLARPAAALPPPPPPPLPLAVLLLHPSAQAAMCGSPHARATS
jgi:hypothetical protein